MQFVDEKALFHAMINEGHDPFMFAFDPVCRWRGQYIAVAGRGYWPVDVLSPTGAVLGVANSIADVLRVLREQKP